MPALITTAIASQNFELIRARICEILALELPNQATLRGEPYLDATVYEERFVAFDKTDVPAVNVTLATGNLDGQTAIQSNGTYTYNIDAYQNAKTAEGEPADTAAMVKLQKILGVCRAILEDPQYGTLGFAPPSISNRHVQSIAIADPNAKDAGSNVMGRISFVVRAPETVTLKTPIPVGGGDTTVKMEATDTGYMYVIDAP